MSNFRPISLLCTFGKIFEKALCMHLSWYFKPIFNDRQHGFIQGRSVLTNLIHFLDYTAEAFSSQGQVDAVYFDCSKAFDTVNHTLLLSKLSNYGLTNDFCRFFSSYLKNRVNVVKCKNTFSAEFTPTSGVPQGSILGPLMFNIYINDIVSSVRHCKLELFADDVKIYKSVSSFVDCELIQSDIQRIAAWSTSNGLALNHRKTKVLSFTRKSVPVCYDYLVAGVKILRVCSVRDLGIIMDHKLLFNEHVQSVVKKAFRVLAIVTRLTARMKDALCFITLYKSLVLPVLEFGSNVWNCLSRTNVLRIEAVQNKFLRFLVYRFPGILSTFQNFLCLEQRRRNSDLIFLHKCIHNKVDSSTITSSLQFYAPARIMRQRAVFSVPDDLRSVSPVQRMQALYNNCLYIDIFSMPLAVFKRALMSYI